MSLMPSVDTAAIGSNWIPDLNRFNLPKPPAWFLKAMWDQDAALVILPSRTNRKYLLARRRERSKVVASVAIAQKPVPGVHFSDGHLLESLKLVKVDAISGNVYGGTWSPMILQELRERDQWEAGGAAGYIAKIEGAELAAELKQRATLLDNIDHRARDAWRSYKARTGQRTRLATASTPPRAKIIPVGTL